MATECWNLHRSLLEENSRSLSINSKLLHYKNLALKLEADLADCNQKRYNLVRTIANLEKQKEDVENNCVELTKKVAHLEGFRSYNKRSIQKLESRIASLEAEKLEKINELYVLLFLCFVFI